MGRSSRWIGWGLGLAFVVAVVGIAVSIYTNRSAATVRGELARISAEGSPVTLRDLAGKKIPDAKNGALIYEKAFALLPKDTGDKDLKLIIRATSISDPIKTQAEWDSLRKSLAKYDATVPLVEQALSLPECQFAIDWNKGALDVMFPHGTKLRYLCKVVCAQAIVSARDGKAADSLKLLGTAVRMGDSLSNSPTLIHFLLKIAIINTASRSLRDCLACGGVSEQDALRLSAALSKIDIADGPAEALKTERVMGIWMFEKLRKDGPGFLGQATGGGSQPAPSTAINGSGVDQEELYYLRKMREYIEIGRMPYREAVASGREIGEPSDIPTNAIICPIMFPVYKRVVVSRDHAQAEINGSRIALALAAYHSQHKAYPASLNEVAGFFGGKVPVDVFSGKSFVYSSWTKGYLLYSVGDNLKDDGGKKGRRNDEGDIVWAVR